jgi:hypothetical protein
LSAGYARIRPLERPLAGWSAPWQRADCAGTRCLIRLLTQRLIPAILFHRAVHSLTEEGMTAHEMAQAMDLPTELRGQII